MQEFAVEASHLKIYWKFTEKWTPLRHCYFLKQQIKELSWNTILKAFGGTKIESSSISFKDFSKSYAFVVPWLNVPLIRNFWKIFAYGPNLL